MASVNETLSQIKFLQERLRQLPPTPATNRVDTRATYVDVREPFLSLFEAAHPHCTHETNEFFCLTTVE